VSETEERHQSVLKLLEGIGLSENESIVYKFLVESGGATTRDLLQKLNLRQPQLYDITSSLERKRFINIQQSRPKYYLPVNTEIILENRAKDIEQSRKELLEWAANSSSSSRRAPAMWISMNWKSFEGNTSEIIGSAEDSLYMETIPSILENFRTALGKAARKGVRMGLLVFGTGRKEYEENLLERDSRIFSEIRMTVPGQFFSTIADMSNSSFMPRKIAFENENRRYGYIFKDRDMSWFFLHNFFEEWFSAKTLYAAPLKIPAVYSIQRIAVNDVQRLMSEGSTRIQVRVTGVDRRSGRRVLLEGRITEISLTQGIVNFSIRTDSRTYTIGGYDSIVEDIESDRIEILRAT